MITWGAKKCVSYTSQNEINKRCEASFGKLYQEDKWFGPNTGPSNSQDNQNSSVPNQPTMLHLCGSILLCDHC